MGPELKGAKTKQQIADEYGICTKTLNKWFRSKHIIFRRGLLNPKEQELIYKKFGTPKNS